MNLMLAQYGAAMRTCCGRPLIHHKTFSMRGLLVAVAASTLIAGGAWYIHLNRQGKAAYDKGRGQLQRYTTIPVSRDEYRMWMRDVAGEKRLDLSNALPADLSRLEFPPTLTGYFQFATWSAPDWSWTDGRSNTLNCERLVLQATILPQTVHAKLRYYTESGQVIAIQYPCSDTFSEYYVQDGKAIVQYRFKAASQK
jgi:hypothetical protein